MSGSCEIDPMHSNEGPHLSSQPPYIFYSNNGGLSHCYSAGNAGAVLEPMADSAMAPYLQCRAGLRLGGSDSGVHSL
jgi:hypothetical protein